MKTDKPRRFTLDEPYKPRRFTPEELSLLALRVAASMVNVLASAMNEDIDPRDKRALMKLVPACFRAVCRRAEE